MSIFINQNPTPWFLIQRCLTRKDSSSRKGVDKILAFDYMGSAEFEFGALGHSITQFRKMGGEITLKKSITKTRFNKPVWIIAATGSDFDAIEFKLMALRNRNIHTKESSYFDYWFDKTTHRDYEKTITSWLVLGCDPVFFSVDEGVARKMLAELKLETASAAD